MSTLDRSQWSKARLGDIGQSLIGLTYSPSNVKRSGTLVLRSSNIQDGELAFDDNVYVDCAIPEKIRTRENDILICVRNGSRRLIGKSAILDRRVSGQTFGAFMAVYRSDLNPFLRYFFQSDDFKRQIDEHLGATINQITNGSLNGFVVTLPSKSEQQAITERLQDVDRLIATLKRLISKKQAIKQGMMQELLTGRTRLPGFYAKWPTEKIGSVLRVRHGRSQSGIEKSNGRYPILATGGEIGRTDTPIYSRPSVLIGRKGTIDRPQYRDEPFWTVDTLFYTEILPQAVPLYIFYLFQTIDWKSMNEASGVPSLSSSRIESIEITLPPVEEQKAIAQVLHDADDEIAALERRLESASNIKQGMMQELLSGRTRLSVPEVSL